MAHTFGTNSTHTSSAGNPISFAFTTSSADTVLVLMLVVVGATNRAGGSPTFAGRDMTQANSTQKAAASPEASAELWYLVNPPTGAYNVVVPNTGALTVWHMVATGRAAAGGRSDFDGANGSNNTGTNPSCGAVAITQPGGISFAVVATGAQTWAPSARTGTQLNDNDDGATGTGRQYQLHAAAGSVTPGWTFGTSEDWGAVAAAFKEVAPVSAPNLLKGVRVASDAWTNERIR